MHKTVMTLVLLHNIRRTRHAVIQSQVSWNDFILNLCYFFFSHIRCWSALEVILSHCLKGVSEKDVFVLNLRILCPHTGVFGLHQMFRANTAFFSIQQDCPMESNLKTLISIVSRKLYLVKQYPNQESSSYWLAVYIWCTHSLLVCIKIGEF